MCLAEAEPQGLRDCWEAGCVLQTDFYDRLGRYPIFARSLPVRYTGATRSHVYTPRMVFDRQPLRSAVGIVRRLSKRSSAIERIGRTNALTVA